jgi:hypothetical protein
MTGLVVVGGVIVLAGDWLEVVLQELHLAQRHRRQNRLPDNANRALAAAIQQAMSAGPARDTPNPGVAHNNNSRWLTVREAAEQLGCTERHVRRIAPQLDGVLASGRWFVPETAIREHVEGRG